jgi:hypothetical protein
MILRNKLLIWLAITTISIFIVIYIAANTQQQLSDITNKAQGQIFPKNNTQSTSPNNRTSIMVIINHGAANYTISDFIPTLIPNKCPMTAHIIDNNNASLGDNIIPAKPVIICYI